MPPLPGYAVLLLFCCAAVVCDIRFKRVPNWLNALAFTCGLALSAVFASLAGITRSLAGASLGLSLLFIPFLLHMVGGGDVKFFAAAGAICGWKTLLVAAFAAAVLGGVLGAAMILIKRRSVKRLKERLWLLCSGSWPTPGSQRVAGEVTVPYTLPLALGLLGVAFARLF